MINCRVTFTLLFLCLYYIVHMLFAGFDVTYGMCIFDVIQSHKLTSDQTMQCVLSVQRSRQFYSSFHRVDISPRSFSVILFIKFMKFMCEQIVCEDDGYYPGIAANFTFREKTGIVVTVVII